MHTTQQIRSASGARARTTIRRNGPMRLAGIGYAAITSLWLGLLLSQGSPDHGIAETLLGMLALTGLGLAVSRDDLVIDSSGRTITHVHGIPGLLRSESYGFADFDGIAVEERGFHRHEAETSRPSPRVSYRASFVDTRTGRSLQIWEAETEDSPSARERLRGQAVRKAEALGTSTSLPVRLPYGAAV
ncbi:MAG: hypothetical protein ACO1SV_26215 [Fimbriimonas sp.]